MNRSSIMVAGELSKSGTQFQHLSCIPSIVGVAPRRPSRNPSKAIPKFVGDGCSARPSQALTSS